MSEHNAQHQHAASGFQPHRGVVILVLGILGLVVCGPLGTVAWIMGRGDLREIKAGRMDPTGAGLTTGGMICGMIATILFVLSLLLGIVFLAIGVLGAGLSAA